jgi:DNA-3-methyladenine glycosylase
MANKLPLSYYRHDDVVSISRDLLGKPLYTRIGGVITGGIIVETEAYRGPEDRGSHAWNGKRTARNDIMYSAGGVVYMYVCYGIHDMLNIVTGDEGISHAVLIRALEPTTGTAEMERRRGISDAGRLCKGPGALAKSLGLTRLHNGASLQGDTIWIGEHASLPEPAVVSSARIGLNIEGPYLDIPWRFFVKGNRFVSARKS